MILLMLSLLVACGPKTPPEPAAAPPAPTVEVATPTPPEPPPAPEPPPEVMNADLNVALTRADGTTVQGHVKRIERSSDWYGEEGWTTETGDLVFNAEGTGEYRKLTWKDVKSVSIKPGAVPADVDCVYDSNYRPWMYDCTLKIPTSVTTKDGKTYTVDSPHKWRFTFDDDTSVEFWMKKHPAREQDEKIVELDTEDPQNYELYTKLQNRLREERTGSMVVKIEVR